MCGTQFFAEDKKGEYNEMSKEWWRFNFRWANKWWFIFGKNTGLSYVIAVVSARGNITFYFSFYNYLLPYRTIRFLHWYHCGRPMLTSNSEDGELICVSTNNKNLLLSICVVELRTRNESWSKNIESDGICRPPSAWKVTEKVPVSLSECGVWTGKLARLCNITTRMGVCA